MTVREFIVDVDADKDILGMASISRKPDGDYAATWHPTPQATTDDRGRAARILRNLADLLEISTITTTDDVGESRRA